MRIVYTLFFLFLFGEAAQAGVWLQCKIQQAKHPERQLDCSQYEQKEKKINDSSNRGKNIPSKEKTPK